MDTITHGLPGALVVRSVLPAKHPGHPFSNRQRLLAGALAGAFPDIVYIACRVAPWSTSPCGNAASRIPLSCCRCGCCLSVYAGLGFQAIPRVALPGIPRGVAVVSHTASDLITVYGTQILVPLSTWRASLGTTFIIAPWFTLVVLAGFIAGFSNTSNRLPRASRAVLLGYLLLQGGLKRQALSIGQDHAS
jgi:inner membrane protein